MGAYEQGLAKAIAQGRMIYLMRHQEPQLSWRAIAKVMHMGEGRVRSLYRLVTPK